MRRPCFLVVDRDYPGNISTRKLVIETAKFNVITAYTGSEAIELADRFPAVDGVVLDANLGDMACEEVIGTLKQRYPKLPIVAIEFPGNPRPEGADLFVSSFNPAALLDALARLVPDEAREVREEEQRAEDLEAPQ